MSSAETVTFPAMKRTERSARLNIRFSSSPGTRFATVCRALFGLWVSDLSSSSTLIVSGERFITWTTVAGSTTIHMTPRN